MDTATFRRLVLQLTGLSSGSIPPILDTATWRRLVLFNLANIGGAGVVSIGGATGAILLGANLSISGQTLNASGGGGGAVPYTPKSSSFAAVANTAYVLDSTSASVTATLPASPSAGDWITILDATNSWASNPLAINGNGNLIAGISKTPSLGIAGQQVTLVWEGGSTGWTFSLSSTPLTNSYPINFLNVAGGGGGSGAIAGGGGGGFLTGSFQSAIGSVISLIVGSGGGLDASGSSSQIKTPTQTFTTAGGGHGNGGSGGSGGGGSDLSPTAGSGTLGQGFAGGTGAGGPPSGGGGGGGGAIGQKGADHSPRDGGGNGGKGFLSSITGTPIYYAGGGGGSGSNGGGAYSNYGQGGQGGGGQGGDDGTIGLPTAGADGLGGGGGGGFAADGAPGGAGVIILRLSTASYSGITTGSPIVTTDGAYTVLQYTNSGTYQV